MVWEEGGGDTASYPILKFACRRHKCSLHKARLFSHPDARTLRSCDQKARQIRKARKLRKAKWICSSVFQ